MIRQILSRLYEMKRLRESSVSISINSKSYSIPYEVTKPKSITVAIAPISNIRYFDLGNLIGAELSKIYYGIKRTPNNNPNTSEWIFNYSYTRKR